MKGYVIITLNLCAMHGANMYTYNKVQYLKKQGYAVFVYSAEQDEIIIPGLREYRKYQLRELRFYPGCFTRNKVRRTLDRIIEEIKSKGCDEFLVESTSLYSALWGEALAERLYCRHLAFILQERFDYLAAEKVFLRFKLARHELAGITKLSVGKMLGDENMPYDRSMLIIPHCTNSIDDCEDTISPLLDESADLTIGSIGRLEKPYVDPMVNQLRVIFNSHPDKRYNFVLIGGTRANKQLKKIKSLFADCRNVNLIMPGALFPVPASFVKRCDVFISAAGSANATYYWKRPTIKLNPNNGQIIGITGLTCAQKSGIYEQNLPITELENNIDLAMDKKDEIAYRDDFNDGSYTQRMVNEFERQLHVPELCETNEYYDTYSIKFGKRFYKPYNILGKVLPVRLLYNSLSLARQYLK